MEVVGFYPTSQRIALVGGHELMKRLDLDYAKSFASSKMPTSILRPVRRKSPRIRRVSGFDPTAPANSFLKLKGFPTDTGKPFFVEMHL